jgi:hypothetical protein
MKTIYLLINRKFFNLFSVGLILLISLTANTSKSQGISTVREIYDFEINDIFHHEYTGGNGTDGETIISNIEIIDKYYSTDNNTVYYVIDCAKKSISSWNPEWTYAFYVDTINYTNLDSLISMGEIDTVYSDIDLYHGRLINQYEENDGNYHLVSKYVVGCGNAEWYSFNAGGGESSDYLVYYKKGSEEWGQPLLVDVSNYKADNLDLTIYPNPTTTSINCKYEKPFNGWVNIYSTQGVLIKKQDLQPELRTIDVSFLNPGIYILIFELNDKTYYKKIIKE